MTSTPLHTIGDELRSLVVMVPLPVVRLVFLAILAAILVWVLRLPREETTAPGAATRGGANLKFGAALALGVQLAIYLLF